MYGERENYVNKQLIDDMPSIGIPRHLKMCNKKFSYTVHEEPSPVEDTLADRNLRLQVIKVSFVYVCVELQGDLNGWWKSFYSASPGI